MTLEARHAILDALQAIVGEEYALAVMEHRKVKKCPLTPLAARILAKQFALCPDPKAAVEEMLNRGWTGFKAEWLAKPQQSFAPPRGKRMNAVEANFSLRAMDHESASQRRDYLDAERVPEHQPGLPSPAADAGQAFGRVERLRHH